MISAGGATSACDGTGAVRGGVEAPLGSAASPRGVEAGEGSPSPRLLFVASGVSVGEGVALFFPLPLLFFDFDFLPGEGDFFAFDGFSFAGEALSVASGVSAGDGVASSSGVGSALVLVLDFFVGLVSSSGAVFVPFLLADFFAGVGAAAASSSAAGSGFALDLDFLAGLASFSGAVFELFLLADFFAGEGVGEVSSSGAGELFAFAFSAEVASSSGVLSVPFFEDFLDEETVGVASAALAELLAFNFFEGLASSSGGDVAAFFALEGEGVGVDSFSGVASGSSSAATPGFFTSSDIGVGFFAAAGWAAVARFTRGVGVGVGVFDLAFLLFEGDLEGAGETVVASRASSSITCPLISGASKALAAISAHIQTRRSTRARELGEAFKRSVLPAPEEPDPVRVPGGGWRSICPPEAKANRSGTSR